MPFVVSSEAVKCKHSVLICRQVQIVLLVLRHFGLEIWVSDTTPSVVSETQVSRPKCQGLVLSLRSYVKVLNSLQQGFDNKTGSRSHCYRGRLVLVIVLHLNYGFYDLGDQYALFVAYRRAYDKIAPVLQKFLQCFDTVGWSSGRASGL